MGKVCVDWIVFTNLAGRRSCEVRILNFPPIWRMKQWLKNFVFGWNLLHIQICSDFLSRSTLINYHCEINGHVFKIFLSFKEHCEHILNFRGWFHQYGLEGMKYKSTFVVWRIKYILSSPLRIAGRRALWSKNNWLHPAGPQDFKWDERKSSTLRSLIPFNLGSEAGKSLKTEVSIVATSKIL